MCIKRQTLCPMRVIIPMDAHPHTSHPRKSNICQNSGKGCGNPSIYTQASFSIMWICPFSNFKNLYKSSRFVPTFSIKKLFTVCLCPELSQFSSYFSKLFTLLGLPLRKYFTITSLNVRQHVPWWALGMQTNFIDIKGAFMTKMMIYVCLLLAPLLNFAPAEIMTITDSILGNQAISS